MLFESLIYLYMYLYVHGEFFKVFIFVFDRVKLEKQLGRRKKQFGVTGDRSLDLIHAKHTLYH